MLLNDIIIYSLSNNIAFFFVTKSRLACDSLKPWVLLFVFAKVLVYIQKSVCPYLWIRQSPFVSNRTYVYWHSMERKVKIWCYHSWSCENTNVCFIWPTYSWINIYHMNNLRYNIITLAVGQAKVRKLMVLFFIVVFVCQRNVTIKLSMWYVTRSVDLCRLKLHDKVFSPHLFSKLCLVTFGEIIMCLCSFCAAGANFPFIN